MKNKISAIYRRTFNEKPDMIVRSPGRINVIGEHTDYNNGFVLPAAIDRAAYLAIGLRKDEVVNLYAVDLDRFFSIELDTLEPQKKPSWPNYILGPLAQFKDRSVPLQGFNAVLLSDIPIGAGLSSSAAIECAAGFALNELFRANFPRMEIVKMAQAAEHEYVGLMCGIMDMFASAMGKADHVIRLDCRDLSYQYYPFRLEGISVLLLNTNVSHSLASSEYNTRRHECAEGVRLVSQHIPGVQSLRDVDLGMLDKYVLPQNKTVDARCRFIVNEISRVEEVCMRLLDGDIAGLGRKMFEAHEGLSKEYEVSCPELDFLVDQVKDNPDVIGARMMGGGFGGCTINLVNDHAVDQLTNELTGKYNAAMGKNLTAYKALIGDGTQVL